jgi:hypothetical protein
MFFFLSKTVFYLVMPFTLICLCLLISFFLKNLKWKKRLRVGGIIMLLFFTNEFIANEVGRWWEIEATPFADMRHYKLAIVLTGATIDKTDPNDRVYFQRGVDRVAWIACIILSNCTSWDLSKEFLSVEDPEVLSEHRGLRPIFLKKP